MSEWISGCCINLFKSFIDQVISGSGIWFFIMSFWSEVLRTLLLVIKIILRMHDKQRPIFNKYIFTPFFLPEVYAQVYKLGRILDHLEIKYRYINQLMHNVYKFSA